jgi:hypothetical protein
MANGREGNWFCPFSYIWFSLPETSHRQTDVELQTFFCQQEAEDSMALFVQISGEKRLNNLTNHNKRELILKGLNCSTIAVSWIQNSDQRGSVLVKMRLTFMYKTKPFQL